jgi:GTP-binding protein HflX
LDPTLRRTYLPNGEFAVLADTVGFIRQLPHDLVEAFSATLEETRDADLLLHVIDAQSNMKEEQVKEVNAVLTEIEAQQVPQLLVYNKIDLIDDCEPRIERMLNGYPRRVWVSAVTGAGIDLLQQAIIECLEKKHE